MAINVKDKLVTVESLGIAYSAEQGARQEADQALSTRIDNIVAPEGDPSLTEVSDARVSGQTTYNTLKARLDADKAAVGTEISLIEDNLGDLASLETLDKSNLVAAINEAAQSGGTEIVIDDTLTQSGQAADAKKTGDEISAIKADLDNRTSFDLWRNISWNDNQYVNYNTGVVDDNNSLSYCVIDISELDIYTLTITSYFSSVAGVVFKSELSVTNVGYISGYNHSSTGEYTDTVEIPEGAKYLYISCVKSKKSVVGVESLINYEVDGCKSRIEDLSNNKMPTTNYCENVDLTIESGIIKKDLSVSTLSTANKHAEKIVTRGTYYVTCYSISASYPGAFYVKDGTAVTLLGGASVTYDNVEIIIPEGVNTLYLNGDINTVLPELRKVTGTVNVESFVNLYCIISNDEAKIKSKYNDKDLIVKFGKGGGNNLPDFRGFSVVNNTSMDVNNKMNGTSVLPVTSDWFAPFVVQAINNIDGDLPTGYESHFTGGNHEYTNTGVGGTATARCTSLKYFVDGAETDNFVGFAKNILIKWTNNVQGNNTKKADGTGREILQENHELYFDGKEWKAWVELVPLEAINMIRWYGLQCPHKGNSTSTVSYVGGANRGVYAGDSNSNSGNNTCPEIRIKTDSFSVILGVDSEYDCGNRLFYDGTSGAFNNGSSKKSYFWIISNTQMALGDRYYLKGYYRFPPI